MNDGRTRATKRLLRHCARMRMCVRWRVCACEGEVARHTAFEQRFRWLGGEDVNGTAPQLRRTKRLTPLPTSTAHSNHRIAPHTIARPPACAATDLNQRAPAACTEKAGRGSTDRPERAAVRTRPT